MRTAASTRSGWPWWASSPRVGKTLRRLFGVQRGLGRVGTQRVRVAHAQQRPAPAAVRAQRRCGCAARRPGRWWPIPAPARCAPAAACTSASAHSACASRGALRALGQRQHRQRVGLGQRQLAQGGQRVQALQVQQRQSLWQPQAGGGQRRSGIPHPLQVRIRRRQVGAQAQLGAAAHPRRPGERGGRVGHQGAARRRPGEAEGVSGRAGGSEVRGGRRLGHARGGAARWVARLEAIIGAGRGCASGAFTGCPPRGGRARLRRARRPA